MKSGKLTPSSSASAVQEAAPPRNDVNSDVALLSSQVGEEIAVATSDNILDAVDAVDSDGAAAMGVRREGGKANSSRTSRRRAW